MTAGEIRDARLFKTGGGKYVWQNISIGAPPRYGSDALYRGYCMVEPADIPRVTEMLMEIGEERLLRSKKSTNFKWLLKKDPSGQSDISSNPGDYASLKDTDPRIAIYADEPGEIIDILQRLASRPEWRQIEANRLAVSVARRPGTNAFTYNGHEIRSLNYNNRRGYSEDEAADPDWRLYKHGIPTGKFKGSDFAMTGEVPNVGALEDDDPWPEAPPRATDVAPWGGTQTPDTRTTQAPAWDGENKESRGQR